jgi:hypothetical protein
MDNEIKKYIESVYELTRQIETTPIKKNYTESPKYYSVGHYLEDIYNEVSIDKKNLEHIGSLNTLIRNKYMFDSAMIYLNSQCDMKINVLCEYTIVKIFLECDCITQHYRDYGKHITLVGYTLRDCLEILANPIRGHNKVSSLCWRYQYLIDFLRDNKDINESKFIGLINDQPVYDHNNYEKILRMSVDKDNGLIVGFKIINLNKLKIYGKLSDIRRIIED